VGITLLGWLVTVGLDLFQNAGVFASFWREPGPAFLPPEKLFQRIPLSYVGFLISAGMFTWLMSRLKVFGWKQGVLFGLKLGGWLSIGWVLGSACVFPIKHSLLLVWFFGGLVQYISAAAVIGSGLSSDRLGRLSVRVIGLVVVLTVATIVMQNLGFAPPMQYK
jgi:small-conductance mechanosensitive channel